MKQFILPVTMIVLAVATVRSDDTPTKDTVDRLTVERAYAKLREHRPTSTTQRSVPSIDTQLNNSPRRSNLKAISEAAATELGAARLDAVRRYRESDSGKEVMSHVDAARRNRFAADELNDLTDRAKAAQILLDAKNRLTQAELQYTTEDAGVRAAIVKLEIAEAEYKREQNDVAKAIALERSEAAKVREDEYAKIRVNVEPGMRVYNITAILGEPERITTTDGDRKNYQWVVYSYGKHKLITRIVTADTQDGAVTTVRDTHYKVDAND